MHYQLVENFQENRDRLQVPDAVKNMRIPMLALHGSSDPTVAVDAVKQMKAWNSGIDIQIIDGADHTFGGGHPFTASVLPRNLEKVAALTMEFFNGETA